MYVPTHTWTPNSPAWVARNSFPQRSEKSDLPKGRKLSSRWARKYADGNHGFWSCTPLATESTSQQVWYQVSRAFGGKASFGDWRPLSSRHLSVATWSRGLFLDFRSACFFFVCRCGTAQSKGRDNWRMAKGDWRERRRRRRQKRKRIKGR